MRPRSTPRLVQLRPRSTATLLLASIVGVLAFGWPLLWATSQVGESAIGHTTDAPWLFVRLSVQRCVHSALVLRDSSPGSSC